MQDDCKTLEDLMERADGALYQAKENGATASWRCKVLHQAK